MIDLHLSYMAKGILVGCAMAAPVGPIAILCIRRTLLNGFLPGLATGLGAATADAVYASVAAFGVQALGAWLSTLSGVLQVLGGAFLIYLGWRIFWQRPRATDIQGGEQAGKHKISQLAADTAGSFLLTMTNPATVLSFIAIFAGFGLLSGDTVSKADASLLVTGVFAGSLGWFCVLAATMTLFRGRMERRGLRALNMISGLMIGGFGAAVLGRFLTAYWLG